MTNLTKTKIKTVANYAMAMLYIEVGLYIIFK